MNTKGLTLIISLIFLIAFLYRWHKVVGYIVVQIVSIGTMREVLS